MPIPRKNAFFGLHFDLHPGATDTELGADITDENITALLDRVRPDYVQYDCKGHAGYAGYPTKIGWASPGIVQDSLAIWRRLTLARDIGLFIHYSGVWDIAAIAHHPEWARIDGDGKPDPNYTSTFGPYVDELLVPQLSEACAAYQLDGVWVDGEAWAVQLDYSPCALEAWRSQTGYSEAPRNRDEPHWLEWKMFHRRQFEKYLCHWVDALHAFDPKLQITSNWAYTTFMPKPVTANLDYLSGDYTPHLSVDRARVEARYLANQGMPWDLMAWGFNSGPGLGQALKTAIHLQQEAAAVLTQGGGFQIYYQPTRAGYVSEAIIDTSAQVAEFCRARQEVSHKSVSVPQVALLLSTATQFDRSDDVFTPYGTIDELEGALHALLELHYSVDILDEHQLRPRMAEFPLIVIPDSYKMPCEFRQALVDYVTNGGSLLLLGRQSAKLFETHLGVRFDGEPERIQTELVTDLGPANDIGEWQNLTLTTGEAAGFRCPTRDTRKNREVAATVATLGSGRIGAVYGPVALNFFSSHHPAMRRFIGDIAARLFPTPAVEVAGPPCLDISLRRTAAGKLSLHLTNLANVPHSERHGVTDFIPEIGPIEVRMRLPEKPERVAWVPGDDGLAWTWSEQTLTVTVQRLHIHGAVVVECERP